MFTYILCCDYLNTSLNVREKYWIGCSLSNKNLPVCPTTSGSIKPAHFPGCSDPQSSAQLKMYHIDWATERAQTDDSSLTDDRKQPGLQNIMLALQTADVLSLCFSYADERRDGWQVRGRSSRPLSSREKKKKWRQHNSHLCLRCQNHGMLNRRLYDLWPSGFSAKTKPDLKHDIKSNGETSSCRNVHWPTGYLQTATDVWARDSKFKTYSMSIFLMHWASNSMKVVDPALQD